MYTTEAVDQDITGILKSNSTLTAEWKADLLDGVMVIKGKWSDGKPLLAIPYYARNNRTAKTPKGRRKGSSIWLKDQ